jgi:hypothetical protein
MLILGSSIAESRHFAVEGVTVGCGAGAWEVGAAAAATPVKLRYVWANASGMVPLADDPRAPEWAPTAPAAQQEGAAGHVPGPQAGESR